MKHFSGEVKRNVQKPIVSLQPKGVPFVTFLPLKVEHFSGEVKRNVQKHIVSFQPKGVPFASCSRDQSHVDTVYIILCKKFLCNLSLYSLCKLM